MKKILKFLLMPILVLAPTMTVIACGSGGVQLSDADILSLAEGQMQNHTFAMKEDLGLMNLPTRRYSNLSSTTRGIITKHYQSQIEPGVNWDNPAVNVSINQSESNLNFLNRYGADVEARLVVTAHLKYKNLESDKNIVIKITNDQTNKKQKVDGITNYLNGYLAAVNPNFSFSTLLSDGLVSNKPGINGQLANIEASLRRTLFTESDTRDPDNTDVPILDVAGVGLSVQLSAPATDTVIYNLNSSAIDTTNEVVTGVLQNLILTLGYQTGEQNAINLATDPNVKSLNIAQNFISVGTQIANILNQGSGFSFEQATLPNSGETIADYDARVGNFIEAVQNKFFNEYIALYYPTGKMNPNWTSGLVDITSQASSSYVMHDFDNPSYGGYFASVNLSFTYKVDDNNSITASVFNVRLNIVQQSN